MPATFKATVNGGIPITKAVALATAIAEIRPTLKQGQKVYVRRLDTPQQVVTFHPDGTIDAHDWLGQECAHPEWVNQARNMLNY